jgi:hypothetical protein
VDRLIGTTTLEGVAEYLDLTEILIVWTISSGRLWASFALSDKLRQIPFYDQQLTKMSEFLQYEC